MIKKLITIALMALYTVPAMAGSSFTGASITGGNIGAVSGGVDYETGLNYTPSTFGSWNRAVGLTMYFTSSYTGTLKSMNYITYSATDGDAGVTDWDGLRMALYLSSDLTTPIAYSGVNTNLALGDNEFLPNVNATINKDVEYVLGIFSLGGSALNFINSQADDEGYNMYYKVGATGLGSVESSTLLASKKMPIYFIIEGAAGQ